MATTSTSNDLKVSITPLLKRLWHENAGPRPDASEIAAALALIFENKLSEVQTGALLTCLHFTERDRQADVLSKCARVMRDFARDIDVEALSKVIRQRGRHEGTYHGGLVSIFCTTQQESWATLNTNRKDSATLLVRAVIHTTLSTFPQRLAFLLRLYYS